MPKVSVLMPVYNADKYLHEAIQSIVNQSFSDWELIIINDGSTDNSPKTINSFRDNRVKVYTNTENLGLIETLNRGISYCTGEYIARMDADDISHVDRLQIQVNFMDKHKGCIMCGTNAFVINQNGVKIGKIVNFEQDSLLRIHLLFSIPFVHPSIMIRKTVCEQNMYDKRYKHVEDYELWCRLSKVGTIANLNENLLSYRWHGTNVSVTYSEAQENLRNEIITNQLNALGINPSKEDLYFHTITFKQFSLGQNQSQAFKDFSGLGVWFRTIIKQNSIRKQYKQSNFIAYIWSRWIVICISNKQYLKALRPPFSVYRPNVVIQLVKILSYITQK